MAIRPRGKGFQVDIKLSGWERIRETFPDHVSAVLYETECQKAHALGLPVPSPLAGGNVKAGAITTLHQLVEHVIEKKWSRLTTDHATKSIRNHRLYEEWAGPNLPVATALSEDKLNAYADYLSDDKRRTGSTVNRHMASMSILVKAARKLRLLDQVDLPKRKEGKVRIRVFQPWEEELILKTLTQWGHEEYRDFFVWLADTGCRPGESTKILWEDINGRAVTLEHEITKNSTQRVIALTPRALEAVERQRNRIGEKGPWTWVKKTMVRAVWERLRGHFEWMDEHTVPYTFRHTCASRLVQRGVDLYRVQIWMGHKSILMTQRYAKFAPKQLADLADVLAAPHP